MKNHNSHLPWVLAMWMPFASATAEIRINEMMASNGATVADEDGDFNDWIELHNSGEDDISLAGYGLSDNPGNPRKWLFPDVTLPAGSYLLVWASGKNRVEPGAPLHTSFSISISGETLVLSDAEGEIADQMPAVVSRRDVSYGRRPDGPGQFAFFTDPTPGGGNAETFFHGILPPPVFSVEGGFYPEAVTVEITSEPAASVYYSTDGSEPGPERLEGEVFSYKYLYPRHPGNPFGPLLERSMTSHSYEQPLLVEDRTMEPNSLAGKINTWFEIPRDPVGNVNKATTIRARAFREGYLPSEIATHSYFIHPEILTRYTLPVVSITTDDANFFDYEKGIYVPGKIADNWRTANPNSGAARYTIPGNATQRGDAWERPVHVEIFKPGGERVLARNLGARIHGGASREMYFKSLRLYERAGYDSGGMMENVFFPGLEMRGEAGTPAGGFSRLLLRNSGNDARALLFRDALLQALIGHLPLETLAYQPVLHYINGESWGIINLRERPDEDYIRRHFGVDPDDVVILFGTGTVEHGSPSDAAHYSALRNYANSQDLSSEAAYTQVKQWMDVENFALYFAFQIYINNVDWPGNNIRFWRKRTPTYEPDAPPGHDGRWRWMVYDTDNSSSIETVSQNTLNRVFTDTTLATLLFRRLLLNEEFRNLVINALADLPNSSFAPARVNAMADEFMLRLDPARDEHYQRWEEYGPSFSGSRNYINHIKGFGEQRPEHVRQHVINRFGLAGSADLTVSADGGGRIQVNRILISEDTPGLPDPANPYPWTGTYFQGVPVKIKALPDPGHRFAGWVELPGEESPEIEVTPDGDATFTALFEKAPETWTIHGWDFQAADFATPSQTAGGGALAGAFSSNGAWLRNIAAQDFPTAHLRVNEPLDAVLTFALPTTGFEQISLEFQSRRSGQGAGSQTLSYTLDGGEWIEFESYEIPDGIPKTFSFDFSGIVETGNCPGFAVRVTFARTEAQIAAGTGMAGNNRFDNVRLKGMAMQGVNLPPMVLEPPGRHEVVAGLEELQVDLTTLFGDPNEEDTLEYTVTVEPPSSAGAAIAGDELSIAGFQAGNVLISVSADDGGNAPVTTSFDLLVYPAPHVLAEKDYLFRDWSPEQPSGSFPPHLLFLQGEDNDDPALATALTRAYEIPAADAASPQNVAFPYAATARTRINGLGAGGISFVNTGRGRDLGSALLALDTRDVESVSLGWVCGTVAPNPRVYALRLQARDGIEGEFADVLTGGQPLEYIRHASAGHRQVFGPVELPEHLLGRRNLQLQWKYHLLSGTEGARPELSLDDIWITANHSPRNYVTWRLKEYPGTEERDDDGISGASADPAGSGVNNLLRYALGLGRNGNPHPLLPELEREEHGITFLFPFDPAKNDLIHRVARSEDLLDWEEKIFDSDVDDWNDLLQEGWLRVTEPEEDRIFYRLEIEQR